MTLGLTGATSGAGYVLVITGVTELFGSIVDPDPASASFTAATDTSRPTVLAASAPAQSLACDVSSPAPCQRSQLTVTFSEPMTQGTGAGGASNTAADALKDASGVATSVSRDVSAERSGVGSYSQLIRAHPLEHSGRPDYVRHQVYDGRDRAPPLRRAA